MEPKLGATPDVIDILGFIVALVGGGTALLSRGGGRLQTCAKGGGRIRWSRELAGLGA